MAPPHRVHFKSSRQTQRKPQAKTLVLFEQILAIAQEYARMSVRQLFYQMVVRGHVEKTEHAYKHVADATVAVASSAISPAGMPGVLSSAGNNRTRCASTAKRGTSEARAALASTLVASR